MKKSAKTIASNPIAKVVAIYRFPAQQLANVDMVVGAGVPGDRQWAIRNGSLEVAGNGQWTPCQAFVRMTRDQGLPLFKVVHHPKQGWYLQHPNKNVVSVQESPTHSPLLATWFDHQAAGFSKAQADGGYWDHADAHISIINLATIKALSQACGKSLDAGRFRGNLVIDTGHPWTELSWVGRRLLVGNIEVEILRPIERCKTTSINPDTAEMDINIPHLLASQFGHIFCGVYARVVRAGRLQQSAQLYDIGVAKRAVIDGAAAKTAPPIESWPKEMEVLERIDENDSIVSFWLANPTAAIGGEIAPTSYIRLHSQLEYKPGCFKPIARSYTLSGYSKDGTQLRISVKRQQPSGQLSTWLHEHIMAGDKLIVSGPFVDPSLQWRASSHAPILILTAGIGMTVARSVLSSLQDANTNAPCRIAHSVKQVSELALWQELLEIGADLPNPKAQLFVTQDSAEACYAIGAKQGRIDLASVLTDFDMSVAHVFICGPSDFNQHMQKALSLMGVEDKKIHQDLFYSAHSTSPVSRSPSATGPFNVRFIQGESEVASTWTAQSGTLLDLAEANGINIPANCRAGACRACLQAVEGPIENILEPVFPAPKGWAYTCCAVPAAAVTIGNKIKQE